MDLSSAPHPASPSQTLNMPTFLMCPPELYDVDYVINPWMEGNVHRSAVSRR